MTWCTCTCTSDYRISSSCCCRQFLLLHFGKTSSASEVFPGVFQPLAVFWILKTLESSTIHLGMYRRSLWHSWICFPNLRAPWNSWRKSHYFWHRSDDDIIVDVSIYVKMNNSVVKNSYLRLVPSEEANNRCFLPSQIQAANAMGFPFSCGNMCRSWYIYSMLPGDRVEMDLVTDWWWVRILRL